MLRTFLAPAAQLTVETIPLWAAPCSRTSSTGSSRRVVRAGTSMVTLENGMGLEKVTAGYALPDDFNVIVEIPMNADPIKYEIDKESGAMFVDRFIGTAMHYPCNYGYVPHTLADDGDPVDVLVITPFPLQPGVVVRCRPLGVLKMQDEGGGDCKLLAVPIDKCLPWYKHWRKTEDIAPERLLQIQHFFEHYKDLEPGKWVKIQGWEGPDAARQEIMEGVENFLRANPRPQF